jgi:hypothetical protein
MADSHNIGFGTRQGQTQSFIIRVGYNRDITVSQPETGMTIPGNFHKDLDNFLRVVD